ncbi:hypothetical protein [Hymenobacter sp. BRD67]|uniref:hypothetical protein n=1 Tax=Hymenobacter sp. BRD67 TaxID=2675877 RepID=UPI001567C549|nr:hypothetical protein [Hymenobacter sp. BRD67]QKG51597.1 hypothetical protein GKZ67_02070 [Hymenobacter sp. BRD67]
MEQLLKLLAQHWHLTTDDYWHLRLLCTLLLGPIVGVLYLVFFDKRTPRTAAGSRPGMWVSREGLLLSQ